MRCNIDPVNKKEFGINVYKNLHEKYGQKNYYEVSEIKEVVKRLGYPVSYECWALVAFMMPANAGEYFRAKETPMDILGMKREFILAMTDGAKNNLTLPSGPKTMYDLEIPELTKVNLVNFIALYEGKNMGIDFVSDLMGGA